MHWMIRTNFKHANEIHVTKETIKVSDNGRGVPCDIDSTGKVSQLELAFCNARAGSNFDDSGRNTIGMNGVGSFCTNCFSTLFKVNSVTKNAKGILIIYQVNYLRNKETVLLNLISLVNMIIYVNLIYIYIRKFYNKKTIKFKKYF